MFLAYHLEISEHVAHSPTKDVVFEMNEKTAWVYGKGNGKYSPVLPG